MRKMYETPEDLKNERIVADKWEERYNCTCHKLPFSYHADFVCMRDSKIVGFIEVKRRELLWGTHQTFMISELKRMNCIKLGEHFGVPSLLVFKYIDGIFWGNFADEPDFHEIGGRKNSMRDSADIEIMAHWNRDRFKTL